ncbi:protein CASC3-like isoform X2 [Watersipora subatra]|uniref:protein CASC3-like isoform X2 n=1 Tax=Watersipora subatra TaxID=2589382 RepID=UPI00355BCF62
MSATANRRRTNPSESELSDVVQTPITADSNDESCEGDSSDYMSDSEVEERDPADGESPHEEQLDDDEDAKNPAFIPRKGMFYEHDSRGDNEPERPAEETDKQKLWKSKEKWGHDRYDERSQAPKSRDELIRDYGYDIKSKDEPPTEPPQSYQSPRGRRGKASFGDFAHFSRGGRGRRGGRGNRGARGGRYQGRGYSSRYNETPPRPGHEKTREEPPKQEMRSSDDKERTPKRRDEPKSQDVREDSKMMERLAEKTEVKPTTVSKAKSTTPSAGKPPESRSANQVVEKKQEPAAPLTHAEGAKASPSPVATEEGRPKRYSKQRQDVAAGPKPVHYAGPPAKPPSGPQQVYVQQPAPLLPPQHFLPAAAPAMPSPVRQPIAGVMPGAPRPPLANTRVPMAPVISQNQPITGTVVSYVGVPAQGLHNQGMSAQGIPTQGMPAQGIPGQGMPAQGIPGQGMPAQGIPTQGMPAQGIPNQGIPSQQIAGQPITAQVLPNPVIPSQHFPQRPLMPNQVPVTTPAEPGMKMGGTVYYQSPPPQRPEGTTYYATQPPPETGATFYGTTQQAPSTPPSGASYYPKPPGPEQQGAVFYNTQTQAASGGQPKPRAKNIIAIVKPEASPNKEERLVSDTDSSNLTQDESSKQLSLEQPIREPVATSHPPDSTTVSSLDTDSNNVDGQVQSVNVEQQIVDHPPTSSLLSDQQKVLEVEKNSIEDRSDELITSSQSAETLDEGDSKDTGMEETQLKSRIQLPENPVNHEKAPSPHDDSMVIESCEGDTVKVEESRLVDLSENEKEKRENCSASGEHTESLLGGGDTETVREKTEIEQEADAPTEQGDASQK